VIFVIVVFTIMPVVWFMFGKHVGARGGVVTPLTNQALSHHQSSPTV